MTHSLCLLIWLPPPPPFVQPHQGLWAFQATQGKSLINGLLLVSSALKAGETSIFTECVRRWQWEEDGRKVLVDLGCSPVSDETSHGFSLGFCTFTFICCCNRQLGSVAGYLKGLWAQAGWGQVLVSLSSWVSNPGDPAMPGTWPDTGRHSDGSSAQ